MSITNIIAIVLIIGYLYWNYYMEVQHDKIVNQNKNKSK